MKNLSALAFSKVTEAAALAAADWVGRGDKNQADDAAVHAMRAVLNQMAIRGKIVIGEGEIDEAPMLYIGEQVGLSREQDEEIEIAVDPIDGTRMTAMGQPNALAVLAAGGKDSLLQAPDMYMEKLVVGRQAKGAIDLNLPLAENLTRIAEQQNKPLSSLRVAILDKPRHHATIQMLHQLGVSVTAIPDGDVAAALQCCLPNATVDVLYGVGGAPEGVIAAVAVLALGGDMQVRLLPRDQVKGDSVENRAHAEQERERCLALNVEVNSVLTLGDLVRDSHVIFCATGITSGDLLGGVIQKNGWKQVETLLIEGMNGAIHRIQSRYPVT